MLKGQWQAARALIGWSQSDLAERVGVTPMTIKRLENHPESVSEDVQAGARAVLEEAGVEFIDGPGVRLTKVYADATRPAALLSSDRTIDCLTLQEAVIAWGNLPPNEQAAATIKVAGADGPLYTASEIKRLWRP